MEALEIIVKVGSAATAFTAIAALIWALIKVAKTVYNFLHTLNTNVDKLLRHDDSQYMAILRLTIINEDMPMSERLQAGKIYIERNGNGDIKKLYHHLLESCELANKLNHEE